MAMDRCPSCGAFVVDCVCGYNLVVERRRPSFEELYLDLARGLSRRSTCRRLAVGCVISSRDHRHLFGVGYNGGATGLANDCESDVPGACGHLHAEENAIINCTAPRSEAKLVYVTHQPCGMCAKRLVNLGGVARVTFLEPYRLRDGVDVLRAAGIGVEGPGA